MKVGFNVNNYSNYSRLNNQRVKSDVQNAEAHKRQPHYASIPSFSSQNVENNQVIPEITEKDINFAVTCCGQEEIKGNTREVFDYRSSMRAAYGENWYDNFKCPHVLHNGNYDEKRNGETTALVIPLHPSTKGIRGADNMAMVLSGNVPRRTLSELVVYMAEVGILNKDPISKIEYYVNSEDPKRFMANPKIKTAIASFFRQKRAEQMNSTDRTEKVNDRKPGYNIKASDINIANIDCRQDSNNNRPVKDYLRAFWKNDNKMTVVPDKFNVGNQEKDMTAILIPSKKSKWDCVTVTVDRKLSEAECKNLINHLVRSNAANVENENFRSAIVEYLNSL